MHRYLRITANGLLLGSTIFGGVAAAYPIIRQKANDIGQIPGEEVDGLYALAVAFPGPSFITLWGAISGRLGGVLGAVIGQVALLLPAFCLVLLLPLLTHIPYVAAHSEGALNGAIWAVAGLLLATGIDDIRKAKSASHIVALAVLLLLLIVGAHPTLVLMLSVLTGVIYSMYNKPRKAA